MTPFAIAPGVVIPLGSYHWRRYRLEGGTTQKRRLWQLDSSQLLVKLQYARRL